MGLTVRFVLLLLAALCFGAAAFSVPQPTRPNFLALGLLFWVLSLIMPT